MSNLHISYKSLGVPLETEIRLTEVSGKPQIYLSVAQIHL